MSRRLLWKEWRERRIVVAALAAAAIAPVVFGSGLSFSGDIGAFSPWLLLPIALAIRLGTGMYAYDGDQDSGDFLFSRPVGWKAVAAAKILPGLAVVLAACVLAALAYILFAAPQYRPHITDERLAAGAAFLAFGAVAAVTILTQTIVNPVWAERLKVEVPELDPFHVVANKAAWTAVILAIVAWSIAEAWLKYRKGRSR